MSQILTQIENITDQLNNIKDIANQQSPLENYLRETDKIILPVMKSLIKEHTENTIWEALEYSLLNKAHFDRACFVRLGCEAVNGNFYEILPLMASVEFRYASGTIIDDVFDDNKERLGRESMPIKYGRNTALSLGVILKSLASISLLSHFKNTKQEEESIISIALKDEITHSQVYLGQIADMESERKSIEEISDSYYLEMIKNATGVDAGYCFEIGCLGGGGSKAQQKLFYNFGVALGTAMQIRDDLIDYIDDSKLINKEPYRDFETNKKRLPIILAYRFGSPGDKETIKKLMLKNRLSNADKIILSSLINNRLVLNYISGLINKLIESANGYFENINESNEANLIIREILTHINVRKN